MEYLRGWRALTSDPQWMSKVLSASLIFLSAMCIPVLGQIVIIGWTSLMLRRAVSGQDTPLPRMELDFEYLKSLLYVGFKGFLGRMIWTMPLMLFSFMAVCCIYGAGILAGVTFAAGASSGSEAGAGLGGLGGLCMMVGAMFILPVIGMLLQMPMHIGIMRAEITDDVNQAMRFKDVLGTTKLLFKELFFGQIVMQLIAMVAVMFGLATLYLGLFPAMVVLMVIQTYWHAELYKRYLELGGEPLPVGPLSVEGEQPPQTPAQPGWGPQ